MNKNAINEQEMISRLGGANQLLPPLRIALLRTEITMGAREVDALLEVSWGDRSSMFGAEIRALSTPKSFQSAVDQILSTNLPAGTSPMVILPFLREENLRTLEARGVSGIDMCGNGVVISNNFRVFRSGKTNRYKASFDIKNVYARNSSMVARAFMCKPGYMTVQAILEEVNARNLLVRDYTRKPMSQSTVSKCLKTLGEDLMITRKQGITVLQAGKLLDVLAENYRPPAKSRTVLCKPAEGSEPIQALARSAQRTSLPVMLTGLSSVTRYAVMQRGDTIRVYCPNATRLLDQSQLVETARFPEIEIFEVPDESVFFDSREGAQGVRFASPVQTYLELMNGDKRDRETAEQVKDAILSELERS